MNDWNEEGDDYEDDCVDDDDNADCGMFPDGGVWTCLQIGSEPCEFCPNRELLGTNSEDDDDSLDSQNAIGEARAESAAPLPPATL